MLSPEGVVSIYPEQWKIYPNPVKDQLTLSFHQGNNAIREIIVTDINGGVKIHEIIKGAQSHVLNMNNLPSGVYLLKINENGMIREMKVVKI